jgi:RNA polymerase sigma factor (sigma-70 family)
LAGKPLPPLSRLTGTARNDEFRDFAAVGFPRLRRAAFLLTGHDQQAEDAAQTALVKTYAAWSRIRRDDPYAYARKVLANHITDQWRRPIREHPGEVVPDRAGPRDLAGDVARQQWLLDVLATLTERERLVVVMRHYFDMPEAEVAGALTYPFCLVHQRVGYTLVRHAYG